VIVVSPRQGLSQDDVRNLAVFTPASLALRELAAYPLLRNPCKGDSGVRLNLIAIGFSMICGTQPRGAYETALSASTGDAVSILDDLIQRTACPVLFVCGEKDKKGAAEARRLFSLAKVGKLATMRDCGFLPMLEYRRQFVKLVEDFTADSQDSSHHRAVLRS
jgi:pimeloyl-ACP methyl ester carboxylesterase